MNDINKLDKWLNTIPEENNPSINNRDSLIALLEASLISIVISLILIWIGVWVI